MKHRILINQPRSSYFVGGAEIVSFEHAKYLAKHGHGVAFVTIDPKSIYRKYSTQYQRFKDAYSNVVEFIEVYQHPRAIDWYKIDPGESRDRWNVESLHYNHSLFSKLTENQEAYKTMISYYKMDAVIVPRQLIHKSILYLCGIPREENSFMSSFLAMYDDAIAITDEVRDYWQKYSKRDIDVIATGVDTNRFHSALKTSKKIHVLFLGRLIERKGADMLIQALHRLSGHERGLVSVTIAGEGPQRQKLYELVERLRLKDSVEFIGQTGEPEKLMALADICVLPSKHGEGLQGVMLEAMASGSFVIASNTKTNQDLIGDSRGAVINPNDVDSITKTLAFAISNHELRRKKARIAQRYVQENYDWNKVIERFERYLR